MQKTFKGPFEPKPEDMKPIEDEPSAFNIIRPVVPPRDPEALTNETKLSFKAVSQAVNAMTIMKNMLKTKLPPSKDATTIPIKKPSKEELFGNVDSLFRKHEQIEMELKMKEMKLKEAGDEDLKKKLEARRKNK